MNDFQQYYSTQISNFEANRKDILMRINSAVPKMKEMHKRQWRSQQLDNSLSDIKSSLASCNAQLDMERAALDKLKQHRDRLKAEEKQLTNDVQLLEGVTGIPANYPNPVKSPALEEIRQISQQYRSRFTDFYFSLPPIEQELPYDPTIERDSIALMRTLEAFILSQFDCRASEAQSGKCVGEKTDEVKELEKTYNEKKSKFDRQMQKQKDRIEQSSQRMKQSIEDQGKQLMKQGAMIATELKRMQDEVERSVSDLKGQKRHLKIQCTSLRSQNQSMRENFKRRGLELENEIDRFHHRLRFIRKNPSQVDQRLVNISLLLTKKSRLIESAIFQIREELQSFQEFVDARSHRYY